MYNQQADVILTNIWRVWQFLLPFLDMELGLSCRSGAYSYVYINALYCCSCNGSGLISLFLSLVLMRQFKLYKNCMFLLISRCNWPCLIITISALTTNKVSSSAGWWWPGSGALSVTSITVCFRKSLCIFNNGKKQSMNIFLQIGFWLQPFQWSLTNRFPQFSQQDHKLVQTFNRARYWSLSPPPITWLLYRSL